MALKIILKPHEKMLLGAAIVQNGGVKSTLFVENNVPILREKDILKEEDATSPCKRIYFVIQLMYVDGDNLVEYHKVYWRLVRDVVNAAPSVLPYIDRISDHILGSHYYQALKLAKELIHYEQEVLLKNAGNTDERLQKNSDGHPVRA